MRLDCDCEMWIPCKDLDFWMFDFDSNFWVCAMDATQEPCLLSMCNIPCTGLDFWVCAMDAMQKTLIFECVPCMPRKKNGVWVCVGQGPWVYWYALDAVWCGNRSSVSHVSITCWLMSRQRDNNGFRFQKCIIVPRGSGLLGAAPYVRMNEIEWGINALPATTKQRCCSHGNGRWPHNLVIFKKYLKLMINSFAQELFGRA